MTNYIYAQMQKKSSFIAFTDLCLVFTMRCFASEGYAIGMCLCVCLSHFSIVSKWLNIESHKQSLMIAQGL